MDKPGSLSARMKGGGGIGITGERESRTTPSRPYPPGIHPREAQMANMELRWQEEKGRILKALKAERAGRKADKRARDKVLLRDASVPVPSSPVDELQDTPSTEQDLSTQLKGLRTDYAALKKLVSNSKLQWEEEKKKLIGALKAERAGRKRAVARMRAMDKVPLKVVSILQRPRPVENVQDTPSTEQELSTQLKELTNDNAALIKLVKNNELRWEDKKRELLAAMLSERAARKEILAGNQEILKDFQDENNTLNEDLLAKQEEVLVLSLKAEKSLEELENCQLAEKVNQLENTIKLLTQQNVDLQVSNLELQVLSQQSDKEKAQIKKNAKKAAKEAEKKLAKERKEKEKEEKKVLKTQKKEREEKAKRDAKELKKQAKERKLREKRGESSVANVTSEAIVTS